MKVGNKKIKKVEGQSAVAQGAGAVRGAQPTRSYQDEEGVVTSKGKGRLVLIVLSFVVVLALVVGAGIYGWMQMRQRDYDTVAAKASQSVTMKKDSGKAAPQGRVKDKSSSKADDDLPSISGNAIDNSSASSDDVKKALVGLPAGITGKSQGALDDTVDYKINQMFDLYGLGLAGTGGILYQSGDYALVCYKGGYTVAVNTAQGIPVALRSADDAFSADTKSKIGSIYADAQYDTLLGKESLILDDSMYAQAKEALTK